MTVTSVGLSIRDEIMLRSLITLVADKSRQRWVYADSGDADLALCDPDSALATIAVKNCKVHGRPLCASVLHGDQMPTPTTRALRAPLRLKPLIEILDAAGSALEVGKTYLPSSTGDGRTEGVGLAHALHQLLIVEGTSTGGWRIGSGDIYLDVSLDERLCSVHAGRLSDSDAAIVHLSMLETPLQRSALMIASQPSAGERANRKPLDQLLWQCGLHSLAVPKVHSIGSAGLVKLTSYPDFGRFGAERAHLAFASHLSLRPCNISDLARATGQSFEKARSFVNACAMIGLIEVVAAAGVPSAPVAAKSRRWPGLMRSLRTALGIERA